MKKFAVIIPAYRPMKSLPEYVHNLIQNGVPHVIVVDDGSGASYKDIFAEIKTFKECILITHPKNKGKGAALKTGFDYFLKHFPSLNGVVTADADGQHAIKDVLQVGKRLDTMDTGFVLGSRTFNLKYMPLRSWIGNRLTSLVFKIFFGQFIRDTQTGLRGITSSELPWVSQLSGDKFDYEMIMLIHMVSKNKRVISVDIKTLYEKNHTSNFETFKDTKLVARALFRQYFKQTESQ
ncbi:MAG TPA: glycosyltransferase family 2 protein [Candidatus Atopostipes pullistercoris]|uniref:Glycosyltransferase family 2 protein n=1 Tax=Candidatus Atopostipes pullistercoris TaxID=2838467 RepID=A0A9D2G190_9LACT|nr:glycosyltransferase family 2 protein [Candidatus Atopostipes pullistercoris]